MSARSKSTSTKRTSPRRKPGGRPVAPPKPATARDWIGGARLRTLPLAVAPVVLGTGAAAAQTPVPNWGLAALCLAVALLLQIGVNFANDYSDGRRGTDAHRVGPARLTASGRAKPGAVLRVALVSFALAAVAGVAIVLITHLWWLLLVGAAAIAAAWFYTGGKRPYGYAGFGELAVFLFFGVAATCGTTLVLIGVVDSESWLSAAAIGCIACAALVVNNLRDITQDAAVGKRTLSVLIGARGSKVLYGILMLVPFLVLLFLSLLYVSASVVFLTLLLAGPAVLITATAKTSKELILALSLTGLTGLVYAVGLSLAIWLGA